MAAIDEDDRETPLLPAPDAVIVATLADIRETLGGRPADAHTRALVAKAESYSRIVERWDAIPPSDAQRAALTELVDELRRQADDEDPPPSSIRLGRVSLKSRPPR